MFKVFIYLYIFLESVLCKTWFWLFTQNGEVGAAVIVAVWVAAGKCPILVALWWRKGGAPCTEWGGSSAPPCRFSTHRWMSPRPWGAITTGSETILCLQPTLPVLLVGQLPLWGGSCPHFFPPRPLPFLYPDPTINAKGAPGTWGGSWPPLPKSSTGRLPPSACPIWPH